MNWDCLKEHTLTLPAFCRRLSMSLLCSVVWFFFKVWVWCVWHSVIKKKKEEEVGLQKVFTSSYTLFEPCAVVICVLLKLIITNQPKPYWHQWEQDGAQRAENKFGGRTNFQFQTSVFAAGLWLGLGHDSQSGQSSVTSGNSAAKSLRTRARRHGGLLPRVRARLAWSASLAAELRLLLRTRPRLILLLLNSPFSWCYYIFQR